MEKNQVRKEIKIIATQKIVRRKKTVVKNEKSLRKYVQKISCPEMEVGAIRSQDKETKGVSRHQKDSSRYR